MSRKTITGILVGVAMAVVALFTINPSTTSYISTTGNDSNSCSQSAPCRTFGRAQQVAQSGWTVAYLDGTYPAFTITKSGINVVALGDVTINAKNVTRGIQVNPGVSDVSIIGFEVINARSHGIHIQGNRILVEGNTVTNSIWENANVTNDIITSCTNGGWGSGIKGAVGASDMTVRWNTVFQNCGEGIALTRVAGGIVEYNTVYDNFSVNIYIDNSYSVDVHHNHSYCTDNSKFYRGGNPARGITLGIENYSGWGNQLRDVTIENNFVQNCRGIRLYNYFSGTPPRIVIRDNWFADSWDAIISVSGASISGNVVGTPPQAWFDAFGTMLTPVPTTPTITPSRTPTRTPTATPTASRTPTNTPTITLTSIVSPSVTPTIMVTPICYPVVVGEDYIGEFCP